MFSERTIYDVLHVEGETAEDERKARRLKGAYESRNFRGSNSSSTHSLTPRCVAAPSSSPPGRCGKCYKRGHTASQCRTGQQKPVGRGRVRREGGAEREPNLGSMMDDMHAALEVGIELDRRAPRPDDAHSRFSPAHTSRCRVVSLTSKHSLPPRRQTSLDMRSFRLESRPLRHNWVTQTTCVCLRAMNPRATATGNAAPC